MTEDEILIETAKAKDKAASIEKRFALAKQKLEEAEKEIQEVAIAATKIKVNLISAKITEELAKTFKQGQSNRSLIRKCLLDSVEPEKVNEIEKKLDGYGTEENDLQKAIELFQERVIIFLKDFLDDFSYQERKVINILNLCDEDTFNKFSSLLKESDKYIWSRLRRRLFIFEDIPLLHDCYIQRCLREVDTYELAVALNNSSKEIQDKIFKNMSKKAGLMLREDMEHHRYEDPKKIYEAKQKILSTLFNLEESGEIILNYRILIENFL